MKIKKKKKKKEKLGSQKMCSALRGRTGDWEVYFQLQAEKNSVNIEQLWVKKWCTKGRQQNPPWPEEWRLDRSIKILERFRTCTCGNLIHTWYYLVLSLYPACRECLVLLYAGLDGCHHSGSFCDFLEAFKQTYIVRPKTPRDLKEFFWATFNHFRQKAKKILSFQEHTDLNFGTDR